jgi:hypothetical protein
MTVFFGGIVVEGATNGRLRQHRRDCQENDALTNNLQLLGFFI